MATDHTKTLVDQALSGASNLYAEFKGLYSMETIRRFLEENADTLVNCKVTVYLPIFAYRFTRERLTAMAQVAGSIPKTMPEVLFVCTHNAGRSQIAAAILDAKAKGKVHVQAADAVITMGCGDACPIYPGKKYEDWDVEDPAGKDLMTVRRIRDDIAGRVDRLILELAPADQTS